MYRIFKIPTSGAEPASIHGIRKECKKQISIYQKMRRRGLSTLFLAFFGVDPLEPLMIFASSSCFLPDGLQTGAWFQHPPPNSNVRECCRRGRRSRIYHIWDGMGTLVSTIVPPDDIILSGAGSGAAIPPQSYHHVSLPPIQHWFQPVFLLRESIELRLGQRWPALKKWKQSWVHLWQMENPQRGHCVNLGAHSSFARRKKVSSPAFHRSTQSLS